MATLEKSDEERQLEVDAKQFLESAVCRRVLDAVLRTYRDQLETSEHDDKELREWCYHQIGAVREFHRQLTSLARSGKLNLVRRARTANGGDSSAA